MYNYFFILILEKYSGKSLIRFNLYSFFIDKSSIVLAIFSISDLLKLFDHYFFLIYLINY